jgi:hypothetical protein
LLELAVLAAVLLLVAVLLLAAPALLPLLRWPSLVELQHSDRLLLACCHRTAGQPCWSIGGCCITGGCWCITGLLMPRGWCMLLLLLLLLQRAQPCKRCGRV